MFPSVVDKLMEVTNGNLGIAVSVDAATKETYELTRSGGNWDKLIENLRYVGILTRRGGIKKFELNFVIQQINVTEVGDFVRLGNELGATKVNFTAIYNVGTYSKDEFEKVGILNENGEIRREFMKYFADPILKSHNVYLPYKG